MVDTISTQYSMPVVNEDGYVLMLPNVGDSGQILQWHKPDPYAESATQLFPLGTRLERGECVWRYCENASTALLIARPVQSAASVNAESADDIVVGVAGEIGGNTISLTSTDNLDASPADEDNTYAEGYIFVNDGAGQGQCRKIKSNQGFDAAEADKIFTVYEDWTIEVTAANGQCGVYQNPFKDVIVAQATLTGMCVGVPGIPITKDYFFWAQTKGPCAVAVNTTISLGTVAVVGTTEGLVDPGAAATTEQVVGFPMTLGVTSTESMLLFLNIDK